MEVAIEFKSPVAWIRKLAESHSARIKILDVRRSGEGVKDLVEIFSPMGGIDGLSSELARDLNIGEESFTMKDDHHATAIVSAHECPICSSMRNWDIFLTEAYSDESGNVTMKWLVPDEKIVSGFMDRLEADGIAFTLLEKRHLSKRGDITARQEFVVRTAFDLGFFEYPKKVNLEGLSQRLNVSYVTLAEILRRAEKNIISSYFKKNRE